MATRIEPFSITVPAGTAIDSFQQTSLPFQDGRVTRVQIIIPPGPSGLVGFRLAHSGQSVIPYTGERWFVADNIPIDWPLEGFPDGSAWEFWAYNLDVYDHTIEAWFHVTDLDAIDTPIVEPLQIFPVGSAEDEDETPEGV